VRSVNVVPTLDPQSNFELDAPEYRDNVSGDAALGDRQYAFLKRYVANHPLYLERIISGVANRSRLVCAQFCEDVKLLDLAMCE
jgi:hypothetical protein